MHVLVAMSGGVDSSVAAALLTEQGHRVTGIFLRSGIEPSPRAAPGKQGCCSAGDALDAARVADLLDIPFYSLDFADEFERIIDDFAAEYARGRTPNPCIACNRDLKFGKLLRFADAIGADAIATGHYAARDEAGGRVRLRIPADRHKDQTYVLFPLDQDQLRRTVFPLANLTKEETRAVARRHALPVTEKPESMEICFVPGGDYREVLEERAPEALRRGPLVEEGSGRVLGEHGGVGAVTMGQRKGLRIGGAGRPLYVTDIDAVSGEVTVGEADALLRREVVVERWNAVSVAPPGPEGLAGLARVRRNHAPQPAVARADLRADGTPQVRVRFPDAVRSPAPGQALVLYDDDGYVLGGGWISGSVR